VVRSPDSWRISVQLVAYGLGRGGNFASWWLPGCGRSLFTNHLGILPAGGFLCRLVNCGLGILHENFLGDVPADFLYGKGFMALYGKRLFPYK
jgi:hypothetical protein